MIGVAALLTLHTLGIATSASAQNLDLYVRGQKKHVHGVNQAWFFSAYGRDLGLNPFHPEWGCAYNGTTANNWLADIKRMRTNVVRVWLFEGLEGLTFNSSGHVTGVQAQFLTNLDDLVTKANNNGLSLYLTFLNHDLVDQWNDPLPGGATVKNFVVPGAARDSFINNAVWTIANRYRNNNSVFGYDLINESNIGANNGSYSWADMRSFAQQGAQKIHWLTGTSQNIRQVTMSTQWYAFGNQNDHPYNYGGLGLDFYDYHEYSSAPNLPSKPSWLDKPILLGEHGPANASTATADAQRNASDTYINNAAYRGWAGNLSWMYWHSSGNGESIATTPGGNQNWENLGWSIQWWGLNKFSL